MPYILLSINPIYSVIRIWTHVSIANSLASTTLVSPLDYFNIVLIGLPAASLPLPHSVPRAIVLRVSHTMSFLCSVSSNVRR